MKDKNIKNLEPSKNMEFSIKYKKRDYWAAAKFKMDKTLVVLKQKKEYKWTAILFKLFSPFILFGIVLYASFKKLKADYKFILSTTGLTRFTNNREQSVKWSRFSCYEKAEKFILLQLDKNEGESDGQVLFPKRCFSETEWLELIGFFEENEVNSGRIDLNMDI